jgi:VHS domain
MKSKTTDHINYTYSSFPQFETKYSTLISTEQATDPSLDAEDWALNMEICDMINESSSDQNSKDAMKAIRKRLTQYIGKNYSVIL